MRLGTKRYFCDGCGAVVDGPGQHCRASCLGAARSKAIDAANAVVIAWPAVNPEFFADLGQTIGKMPRPPPRPPPERAPRGS